jgi:hypothetical protein
MGFLDCLVVEMVALWWRCGGVVVLVMTSGLGLGEGRLMGDQQ